MNDKRGLVGGTGLIRSAVIGLAALALLGVGCDSDAGGVGDFGAQCPSDATSFERMNAATYAVVLKIRNGPQPENVEYMTLGTAFAIGDRLLATNAHITEFFNGLQGVQVEDVVGVQSGTGKVVKLLRALTHPDYNGDPLGSPDVGLLTSQDVLPVHLPFATEGEVASLRLGDGVQIAGFPGDVNEFIAITPGTSIPQATSLSGQITAFRNHASNVAVTPDNTDVIQHQAPTTPGTSGSAMVHCGKVIAANNAGTVKVVEIRIQNSETTTDRQAAAANNFGVHNRYLHEMVELFEDSAVQGFALPPAFVPAGGTTGPSPTQPGPTEPAPTGIQAMTGTYQGGVNTPANASHGFAFAVAADGIVRGSSMWPQSGGFGLIGEIDAQGNIVMIDDAFERAGFMTGIYIGRIDAEGVASGVYAEGDENNVLASWAASR